MRKLKICIITILIIIIILLFTIIKLTEDKDEINNESNNTLVSVVRSEKGIEVNSSGFSDVTDTNMFFTILNIMNKYMGVINYMVNASDTINENPYNITNDNDKKLILYNMLDEKYMEDNNIKSEEDIEISENAINFSLIPIQMKVRYGNNVSVYIASTYVENLDSKTMEKVTFMINLCNQDGESTFSIAQVDNIEDLNDFNINYEPDKIVKNNYNTYTILEMSKEGLIKYYVQTFKYLEVNYTELFYENYLNEEYRNKRFQNINNFVEWVNEYKDKINETKCIRYVENNLDNYTQYIWEDQNGNQYIINAKAIMNVDISLDTYTIDLQEFVNEYEKATDEEKVAMNINKFILALNSYDYDYIYNILNDNFRNNNFATKEELKEYLKNNFYANNTIGGNASIEALSLYYECTINIENTEDNSQTKKATFIMKLGDGVDFEISFSIK